MANRVSWLNSENSGFSHTVFTLTTMNSKHTLDNSVAFAFVDYFSLIITLDHTSFKSLNTFSDDNKFMSCCLHSFCKVGTWYLSASKYNGIRYCNGTSTLSQLIFSFWNSQIGIDVFKQQEKYIIFFIYFDQRLPHKKWKFNFSYLIRFFHSNSQHWIKNFRSCT